MPGDGLAYLTASQPVNDYAASWRRATNPQRWRWAMQQSIIALREGESRDRAGLADPNEEGRMRRLARERLLAGEGAWREPANRWCSLVLRRTSRKIHDTQLAFAGFLIEASEPLSSIGNAGHRFHRVLQGIFASFTTAALQRLLNEGLEILEEELARNPAEDDRMLKAIRFIKDRAHEPLSLAEVAHEARMHPTAFSRKFRATQAQTFTDYLQSIRIERAINLLKGTRRTVLDIALECGFGSAEQFHRVFKRRMKVTPHAFRRNHTPKAACSS